MTQYTLPMILEWTKVFDRNADMGDPNGHQAAKSVAKRGGQYITNAYFTSQDQIDKLLSEGLDPHPMNGNRIKDGNPELGIGKYLQLKRWKEDDIRTFNNKNGDVTVNFGGPVKVFDFQDYYAKSPDERDVTDVTVWDEDQDIGNGSSAMVVFDTYSNGAGVRLVKLGITDLVVYEAEKTEEEALFGDL